MTHRGAPPSIRFAGTRGIDAETYERIVTAERMRHLCGNPSVADLTRFVGLHSQNVAREREERSET